MTVIPPAASVLAHQKDLRSSILDRRDAVGWAPGRELAAHLLLMLDDPSSCWRLSAEWLREAFNVERVDAGHGSPSAALYAPALAEARRPDADVPSMRGVFVSNHEPAVAGLWNSPNPVVLSDVAHDGPLGRDLRMALLGAGTSAKIASSLAHRGHRFGLVCMDRVGGRRDWSAGQYAAFDSLARDVLGPILWTSMRLADPHNAGEAIADDVIPDAPTERLTPAERRIAQLAASGMSYKEIARAVDRSFSTVDHQLRSIRAKLGVNSNARLVTLLSRGDRDIRA